jgi:hypothetical protein
VFELNFMDERYIPFEGAGAISKWQIELPAAFQQFDYDTISDVILHVRYTAVEGGDKLRAAAALSVQAYVNGMAELSKQEGLFAVFDLKHEFPTEWSRFMNPGAGATERVLTLNKLYERLPIFTKGWKLEKIQATDLYLFIWSKTINGVESAALSAPLVLLPSAEEFTSPNGRSPFVMKDTKLAMNSWQLKTVDVTTDIQKLWLVVRYVLAK